MEQAADPVGRRHARARLVQLGVTVGAIASANVAVPHDAEEEGAPAAPVRVLFVIYGLARAGPELRILELARHLPTVHVCVIGDDLTLLEEYRKTGANVVIVPIRRPHVEWRQIRTILAYIREHDIQVVNSFDLKTLLVGAAAKLRYGSRVKLVHHLISLWEDVRFHHRSALWAALRGADRIVCNGYAVRDQVIGARRLAAAVSVIPNGVDCAEFQPSAQMRVAERRRLGFTGEHFVLGTVANVRPVKNWPLLLNAMARVAARYPNARLVCVGGGPQLQEMKTLAQSLGLGEKVIFTGVAEDVRPLLSAMDAFVLCSNKEGNPNVVLQAMAMSLPVISTSVGEVPHLIQDGVSGVLFAPGDEAAFVAAIARFADDERLRRRVGAAGRRRVEWRHSSSQMVAGYDSLMREAVAEWHPPCSGGHASQPGHGEIRTGS
jgi:glycosyltransferase involved in cell wall biosynthesis